MSAKSHKEFAEKACQELTNRGAPPIVVIGISHINDKFGLQIAAQTDSMSHLLLILKDAAKEIESQIINETKNN